MTPENLSATYECCGFYFVITLDFRNRKRTTFLKTAADSIAPDDLRYCPGCGAKIPDLKVEEAVRKEDGDLTPDGGGCGGSK